MKDALSPSLKTKISGSFLTQFWLELFGNSAHFPIANILFELLLEKPFLAYLRKPDLYVIVTAALVQAYFLARWRDKPRQRRFLGSLIAPLLYTVVEGLLEGPKFFAAPHHLAYWGFSLAIGAFQALQLAWPSVFAVPLIVAENVTRTSILFFMYAMFEMYANPKQTSSWSAFFADGSHVFIGLAVLFLGLIIGFANVTADRYLSLLKQTLAQLRIYSEWLLGRRLLQQALEDPSSLRLARSERAVLFMDVRNFTHWSEGHSPEAVVNLLNEYYRISESVLTQHEAIKFKFSADEVMAVFPTIEVAIQAALELRRRISESLASYRLGAGIGLHAGPLVEGLLGGTGVRFYDVIGDTVNTGKRIESAAQGGEILISEAAREMTVQAFSTGVGREIMAKGKEEPLMVYPIEG